MKHRTSTLEGALLDAAVAKELGWVERPVQKVGDFGLRGYWSTFDKDYNAWNTRIAVDDFNPSSNWAHGGPIIERERIDLKAAKSHDGWVAFRRGMLPTHGPTPLVAAMRAFIASKLGEEVELP